MQMTWSLLMLNKILSESEAEFKLKHGEILPQYPE